MVIDLKLLGVALKNYHPYLFLNFYQQYENFNFYDKSELKDSTIYIIDSQDFVGVLDNKSIKGSFIVNDSSEILKKVKRNRNLNIIALREENVSKFQIGNKLMDFFKHFYETNYTLHSMIAEKVKLPQMCDFLSKNLFADFSILDLQKKIIFDNSKKQEITHFYPLKITGNKFAYFGCSSVQDEDILNAYLNGFIPPLSTYVYDTIATLNEKVDLLYNSLQIYIKNEESALDISKLNDIGWNSNDDFLIFVLNKNYILSGRGTLLIWKNRFILDNSNYMFSVIDNDNERVILFANVTNNKNIIQDTENLLKEYTIPYSKSMLFNDLSMFKSALDFAYWILNNKISNDEKSIENYSEYVLENINLRALISPKIIKLYNYDLDTNSQLLKTLYFYLTEERSLKNAGEILDIHRNSVVYRLSKIEEIIDIDFESAIERITLINSIKLFSYYYDYKLSNQ